MLHQIKSFFNQFFPQYCVHCKKPVLITDNTLCSQCLGEIEYTQNCCPRCSSYTEEQSYCEICNDREFYIDKHISIAEYTGVIKNIVYALKFKNNVSIMHHINHIMLNAAGEFKIKSDIITCVPIEKKNKWRRGFNQSQLMAVALANSMQISFLNLLKINKKFKNQKELSYTNRFLAIIDKYALQKNQDLSGKQILIVDDVFTTGATLNECARVLKNNGAEKVYTISLARVRKIV